MKMSALVFLVLASISFAKSACDSQYDQCIQACCGNCGSTLSVNDDGDFVCNVGTQDQPNTACIQACLPCSTQYQQCITSEGTNSSPSASCCGTAALLAGIAAFAFLRR